MIPPSVVGLDCPVVSEQIELEYERGGFHEEVRVELAGSEACRGVDLVLPDGVELVGLRGRVQPDDDPAYRLDAARFERVSVASDGTRVWRVHLPELAPGDVAVLRFERDWRAAVDYAWAPGADGAGFAELRMPRSYAVDEAHGLRRDGAVLWAERPDADARASVRHPWAPRGAPELPPIAGPGLTTDDALRRVAALRLVEPAWFGGSPRVGDDAFALGATDARGIARTLVALTDGGPEHVALGRWSADPGAEPAPGAPEAAVRDGADGPARLAHPDDASTPVGGAFVVRTPGATTVTVTPEAVRRGPVAGTPGGPPPVVATELSVEVEGRDPLARLRPGGGLTLRVTHRLTWPDGLAAPWVGWSPLPAGTLRVEEPLARDCSHLRASGDAVWLVAAPGSRACTFTVVLPLDDVWGRLPTLALPGAVTTVSGRAVWDAPDGTTVAGELVIEGGTWRLAGLAGHTLLADRGVLEHELADRFVVAAMPEPGLSAAARAGRSGWTLAAALRGLLAERVLVRPLPAEPDRPRPLVPARRSRVVTPGEAAMIGALYLRQSGTPQRRAARLDATWALVRPRTAPGGDDATPADFTAGLIRVEHDGRGAWIDPGCDACAPFEIPPELVGADAIGPGPDVVAPIALADGLPRGLAVRDGLWVLDGPLAPYGVGASRLELGAPDVDGTVPLRWRLDGADALALRRALAAIAPASRAGWLRERLGAAPGAPLDLQGLADPGAPVVIATRARLDATPDALTVPLAGAPPPGGGWIGLREVRRPAPDAASTVVGDDPDALSACRVAVVDGVRIEQALTRAPDVGPPTCPP